MPEQTELLLERLRAALAEGAEPNALRKVLLGAAEEDVAEVIELLDDDEQQTIMHTLDVSSAGEVLALLDEAALADVADNLGDDKLTDMVATLEPDEAADVLGDLPADRSEQVLDQLPDEQSRQVEKLLQYDPETAGGLMTPVLVTVPETHTVSQAVVQLRQTGIDSELFYVYVVDEQRKLRGVVPLWLLVTAKPDTLVTNVMSDELTTVGVDEDQEEVVNILRKYDLAAVPVVDPSGRLLGRITHDDIMDVADEEAEEDMLHMAGTEPAEMETSSALRAVSIRGRWLAACLIGTGITATVMAFFNDKMPATVYLVLMIFGPAIAAISGNSGVQASTLTVLGLSGGSLAGRRFSRATWYELRIALGLAILFGIAAGICVKLAAPALIDARKWPQDVSPALVATSVGGAMLLTIFYATLLGTLLPFILRRLGMDPAIASGPLVTTLNDSTSWAIYLLLATMLLRMGL